MGHGQGGPSSPAVVGPVPATVTPSRLGRTWPLPPSPGPGTWLAGRPGRAGPGPSREPRGLRCSRCGLPPPPGAEEARVVLSFLSHHTREPRSHWGRRAGLRVPARWPRGHHPAPWLPPLGGSPGTAGPRRAPPPAPGGTAVLAPPREEGDVHMAEDQPAGRGHPGARQDGGAASAGAGGGPAAAPCAPWPSEPRAPLACTP